MKIWKTTHMVQLPDGSFRWRESARGTTPTWFKNLSVHTSPVMQQVTADEVRTLERLWQTLQTSQTL